MRTRFAPVALAIGLGTLVAGAADAPAPLVKPVSPAGNSTRIRLPMSTKQASSYFKAQIVKPKARKGDGTEIFDITLSVSVQGFTPTVSTQQWKAWGFEVPMNRAAVLPELIIPGAQVAPKPAKGRDAEYRVRDLKVSLYEAAGGEKAGISNSLGIPMSYLTGGADRQFEPRVHFADRFIELTAPNSGIKRLNAGEATSPDPRVTTDEKLVPSFIPMNASAFTFVTVNSHTQYTRPTRTLPVVASMDIGAGTPITMAVNMARGCEVEMDAEETTGKVRELRLGPITGPGVKGQKDLVLRNVPVAIYKNEDAASLWFSASFVEEYFKDGVYGCGSDGLWRLHGRVKPELIEDVKTRKPAPPPKKP